MKQFYNIFSNEKVSTLSTQLTWSHYKELLPLNNNDELLYYYRLCINNSIDVRSLRNRIKSKEYQRLPEITKNNIINQKDFNIIDFVKNPILIKNNCKKL